MPDNPGRLRAAFDLGVPWPASEGRRDTEPAVSATMNGVTRAARNERRVQTKPCFQGQSSRTRIRRACDGVIPMDDDSALTVW